MPAARRSGTPQTPQRLIRKTVPGSLQEHACRTQPVPTALQKAEAGVGAKAPTGHVPSSRCQTPAGAQRAARESTNLSGRASSWQSQPAGGASPLAEPARWWSQTGSNRRPQACKARALPTELWPHPGAPPASPSARKADRADARESQGDGRRRRRLRPPRMVGLGRLERPTSPLSGVRSNHLSYRPGGRQAQGPAPVRKDD